MQDQKAVEKNFFGVCFVFCPHTTAGLTANENADPDVVTDIISRMRKVVPADDVYKHSEGNSDAHIKSSIFGADLTILVEKGCMLLGRWQGIYLCESDGPRTRELWIKIIADQ